MEDDIKLREIIQKKLVGNPNNPYHRLGMGNKKTLGYTPKNDAAKFYSFTYRERSFVSVILTNQGNMSMDSSQALFDNLTAFMNDKKEDRLSQGPRIENKIRAMPFKNLPKLIATHSSYSDFITLTYQYSTSIEKEVEFESSKYISYVLEFTLREHFHSNMLAHNVSVTSEIFDGFGLLSIEIHYSIRGKEKTDVIIASVLGSIEAVIQNFNFESYTEVAEELRNIFNTKNVPKGTKFAVSLAKGINKYGYAHALRATNTLNYFSSFQIDSILDQLNFDNLLITIQGDFSKVAVPLTKEVRYNLKEILNKRIMKKFIFGEEDLKNQGSLILDRYDTDLGKYYHIQGISKEEISHLEKMKLKNPAVFRDHNPFKITNNFARLALKKGTFNIKKLNLGVIESLDNGIFYRKNDLFSVPYNYLSLRFAFIRAASQMIQTKKKFHAFSLVMEFVWKRRLTLVSQYTKQFNGEIEVKFEHGTLILNIYAPDQHFVKIYKRVLDEVNIFENPLVLFEAEMGMERAFRKLELEYLSYKRAEIDFDNLIIENQFSSLLTMAYLHYDHSVLKSINDNPRLVYGFYEGSRNKTDVMEMFDWVKKIFKR